MRNHIIPFYIIIIGILIVLRSGRKVSLISQKAFNPIYFEHAPSLEKYHFKPASLNESIIHDLVSSMNKSPYNQDLSWFASQTIFESYVTRDGLHLQVYKTISDANKYGPVYVFSCGYTETVLKYSLIIRKLFEKGATVYAFDMRGQGFSESTGWNDGRVTHIENIADYTTDLQDFVDNIVVPETQLDGKRPIIYVGNSLGGLVGIMAQNTYTDKNHKRPTLFDKLVLVTPCIQPTSTNAVVGHIVESLYWLFPVARDALIARLQKSSPPEDMSHNVLFIEWWENLRRLASRQLVVAGPSLGWIRSVYQAGVMSYTSKGAGLDNADILVLSAGSDTVVSLDKIHAFYEFVSGGVQSTSGMPHGFESHGIFDLKTETRMTKKSNSLRRHIVVKECRHEMWAESSTIVNLVLEEVHAFVSH